MLLENGGMCPVTLQGIPRGAEYSIVIMLQQVNENGESDEVI